MHLFVQIKNFNHPGVFIRPFIVLSLVKWHVENEGMIRAEPFDDLSLIAAYSSITYEIIEALNGKAPDILVAPVGGGGLISGIAAAMRLAGKKASIDSSEYRKAIFWTLSQEIREKYDEGGANDVTFCAR